MPMSRPVISVNEGGVCSVPLRHHGEKVVSREVGVGRNSSIIYTLLI
jgi:hypothetical protein